jgi:DNA gyrase/topoisomerase IV subunit A
MSSFSHKIDEWMKEAETRPESAVTIVRLIAKRLSELTARNEELLAENIALQNGTRVEEYQKRIAHLEYQLDLLKRRFGADESLLAELPAASAETSTLSLLIYNNYGRIFRIEINSDVQDLGRIVDETLQNSEQPRLLAVPSNEEVLLLFTSGRVSTCAVNTISTVEPGNEWSWDKSALPDEPRAGEFLAGVMPISHLPLSEFFMQVSRRGCVKKTMTSMAQSILGNHYIGKNTLQKSDQPFDVTLCSKKDLYAFVTFDGKLIGLDVNELSYSAEDRIKLTASDYVIASFVPHEDESMLFVTQTGKVIHREHDSLELSKSPLAKGQALISAARLEQGIRFIGAASVRDRDRIVVLDSKGRLRVHSAESITGSGSIEAEGLTGEAVSIGVIQSSNLAKVANLRKVEESS